jgi:hypothetical protein
MAAKLLSQAGGLGRLESCSWKAATGRGLRRPPPLSSFKGQPTRLAYPRQGGSAVQVAPSRYGG